MTILNDPAVWFKDLFIDAGLSKSFSTFLSTTALVVIIILLSWITNLIAKTVIKKTVSIVARKTHSKWDHIFLENKVFTRLSHLAPALVIWLTAGWALKAYPSGLILVHKLAYVYIAVIGMVVLNSFIEAWHKIYITLPISQHRHIKGYVQLLKILVIVIASLIIVSVIFRKDISTLVAGLSAMAAVLLFVFKDVLLGLVASIQLSADDMVKVGDWITIPGRDVDGVVFDITLNTVKVQNFDKTIITVPTYSLVNESFQNWKGMEESGIRQIKRAMIIDIQSIRFIEKDLKEKLSGIPLLKEYIESAERESSVMKDEEDNIMDTFFNSSRLTNLGIFRYYAETYLKQNPLIDSTQTVILRHRPPEEYGLPLQVFVFVKNSHMVPYENVQSEIFEHLFAIMNEFELRIFQQLR